LTVGNVLLAKPGKGKGNEGNGNKSEAGAAADFVPPGHRRAPVEVVVTQAPPALRVEAKTVRPSANHVWVSGFWTWQGNEYVWTSAMWILPPAPAAVWVQPRYESRSGVNIFITGYWRL
jgi:hypothetical protein